MNEVGETLTTHFIVTDKIKREGETTKQVTIVYNNEPRVVFLKDQEVSSRVYQ